VAETEQGGEFLASLTALDPGALKRKRIRRPARNFSGSSGISYKAALG